MAQIFLEKAEEIAEVEHDVRNKFRMEWLTDKDPRGDVYSDWVQKSKIPGVVFCSYCHMYIKYGSTDLKPLAQHAKSKKHTLIREALKLNHEQPSCTQPTSSITSTHSETKLASPPPNEDAPNSNTTFKMQGSLGKSDIAEIDRSTRNKFQIQWLAKKDPHGDFYSDWLQKSRIAGVAECTYCHIYIKYGSTGLRPITDHTKSKRHTQNREYLKVNQKKLTYTQKTSSVKPIPSETTSASLLANKGTPSPSTTFEVQGFLQKADEIAEVESEVRNKFQIEWLTGKDPHGDLYSDWLRKPKIAGVAFCTYCNVYIKYESTGIKRPLAVHAGSKHHTQSRECLKLNQEQLLSLQLTFSRTPSSSETIVASPIPNSEAPNSDTPSKVQGFPENVNEIAGVECDESKEHTQSRESLKLDNEQASFLQPAFRGTHSPSETMLASPIPAGEAISLNTSSKVQGFLAKTDEIVEVDHGMRNKYQMEWLTEKDPHGDLYSDWLRKPVIAGVAFCTYCNVHIKYESTDISPIAKHAESKQHAQNRESLKSNQEQPLCQQPSETMAASQSPAGGAPSSSTLSKVQGFLQNADEVAEVDCGMKNRFRMEWLTEKDPNGDLYSDWLRKPKITGIAFCIYCHVSIRYAVTGLGQLAGHAVCRKHLQHRQFPKASWEDPTFIILPSSIVALPSKTTSSSSQLHSATSDGTTTSMLQGFLDKSEEIAKVDHDVRNKFREQWLTYKDAHGDLYSDWLRKPKVAGVGFCIYCNCYIKYGGGGVNLLSLHAASRRHTQIRKSIVFDQDRPLRTQSPINIMPLPSMTTPVAQSLGTSSMMQDFLEKAEEIDVVDRQVKNKFRLKWLKEKDPSGDLYSNWLRKPKHAGQAYCLYCHIYVWYGSSGETALMKHAKKIQHMNCRPINKTKDPPLSLGSPSIITVMPSDVPLKSPVPRASRPTSSVMIPSKKLKSEDVPTAGPCVPCIERMEHYKATALLFAQEQKLDLSLIPHLIEYGKFVGRENYISKHVKMTSNSAAYKLNKGLASAVQNKLICALRQTNFSISLYGYRQSEQNNVLEVMVQHFSEEEDTVVCKHYKAFDIPSANGDLVYKTIMDQFKADDISLSNMISSLCDRSSNLDISNEGLKARLKDVAPNLVDIGEDSCHTVHNVVKKLCSYLDNSLTEKLCDDISDDIDSSPDIRDHLVKLCLDITAEKYQKPKERVAENWLSFLDCIDTLLQMLNALSFLYWHWLPADCKEDKKLVEQYLELQPKNMTAAQATLLCSADVSSSITGTAKEQTRRVIIAEQLWLRRTHILTHLYFYSFLLKDFKIYIETFQNSKPMIHKIFGEQEKLLRWFLSLFLQPEVINKFGNDLQQLDIAETAKHCPLKEIGIGTRCKEFLESLPEDRPFRQQFFEKVQKAYIETATYFQPRFGQSKVLRHCSALDPAAMRNSATLSEMRLLLQDFPRLLSDEAYDDYEKEVVALQVDTSLPEWDVEKQELGNWWGTVIRSGRYPNVGIIVKAVLSIITSTGFEEIVSNMSAGKTRTSLKTINAVNTVTSYLQNKRNLTGPFKSKSLNLMYRANVLKDPVDSTLCSSILRAERNRKKGAKKKKDKNSQPGKSCDPDHIPALKRMSQLSAESPPSKKHKKIQMKHQNKEKDKRENLTTETIVPSPHPEDMTPKEQ